MDFLEEFRYTDVPFKDISLIVRKKYNIYKSPNAISKIWRRKGFPKRKGPTIHSRMEIKTGMRLLIRDLPHTVGYRNMTSILRQKGVHVRRDMVMELMREIDAYGVQNRRRRRINRKVYRSMGPNHAWHIDGYDKLKPYGFSIHGCIDGYSRKIIWLRVGPTNSDSKVVAYYYVRSIMEYNGVPLVLQSDPGTENVLIGALQCTLRHEADDYFAGIKSFRVVRSKFNQRIEAWWSMFRRQSSEWWINFFKDLVSFGEFNRDNVVDIQCLRYCFMPVVQQELNLLVERWNNHHISANRNAACPNGRPNTLHIAPEDSGGTDCLQPVEEIDIDFALHLCKVSTISGSLEFDQRAADLYQNLAWKEAERWEDALKKYFYLREKMLINA